MSQLGSMERRAYRASFDDGLLDLFIGVSLLGAGLIWLTDLAGLGGLVPVLLIPLWEPVRRRLTARRTGYVQFSAARRSKERRNLFALAGLGSLFFLFGVGMFFLAEEGLSEVMETIVPGLPALLLAIGAFSAFALYELRRIAAYGGLLVVSAVLTIVFEGHPGLAMAGPGAVILVIAIWLVVSYVRGNPVVEGQG